MKKLEKLVGRRFAGLDELKKEIERLIRKKVTSIGEADPEFQMKGIEHLDNLIDYEINEQFFTIWYLKDNGGKYYITEV
jgi:hypothetical protein